MLCFRIASKARVCATSLRSLKTSAPIFQELGTPQDGLAEVNLERPQIPVSKLNLPARRLIPLSLGEEIPRNHELERLRVVPKLKTFYGGNPIHEENINLLNELIRRHINLPTRIVDDKELQSTRFISFEEYRQQVKGGTRLKPVHHKELTQLLHRLRSIDPQLMPKEVTDALKEFMTVNKEAVKVAEKTKTLDNFGRAIASAKRKASSAKVYLVRGEGEALINGKSLVEYFPKDSDRRRVVYPFQVVCQEGNFNFFSHVSGGGSTGQADATMYAIAKCLVIFNPLFKSRLYKAGLMTSDSRKVERKKPGKVKARKSPTWVKR